MKKILFLISLILYSANLYAVPVILHGEVSGLEPQDSISYNLTVGESNVTATRGNGVFDFPLTAEPGTPYSVTITESPEDNACTVAHATGVYGDEPNVYFACRPRDISKMAVGGHHTCVLSSGISPDSKILRCWGFNEFGQLGLGHSDNIGDDETPEGSANVQVSGAVNTVVTGGNHTCVLLDTGKIKCWGNNSHGQLGYGVASLKLGDDQNEIPALLDEVPLTERVIKLAAGNRHTCAVVASEATQNLEIRCWGDNSFGQLGLGSDVDHVGANDTPEAHPYVNFRHEDNELIRQLTVGGNTTCVILENDATRCWGENNHGQLGYNDTIHRGRLPADMPPENLSLLDPEENYGLLAIESLSLGGDHSCATIRLSNGEIILRCWGWAAGGRLGNGDPNENIGDDEDDWTLYDEHYRVVTNNGDDYYNYVPVAGLYDPLLGRFEEGSIIRQSTGLHHACAWIVDDFQDLVRCWGEGSFLGYGHESHIGDNEAPYEAGNVLVTDPQNELDMEIRDIEASYWHSCVSFVGGQVRCWGQGVFGQLGYGSIDSWGNDEGEDPFIAGNVAIGFHGYGLSGNLLGLVDGRELTLAFNGEDVLELSDNGTFSISSGIPEGTHYEVSISEQPEGQNCVLENSTGVMGAQNQRDLLVSCIENGFQVSGSIEGFTGNLVTLHLEADGNIYILNKNADGPFTFPPFLEIGTAYEVSVEGEPQGHPLSPQQCIVRNNSGVIAAAVDNVEVECFDVHRIGLLHNGNILEEGEEIILHLRTNHEEMEFGVEENITVNQIGIHFFDILIREGSNYTITVSAKPFRQRCSFQNESGLVVENLHNQIILTCTEKALRIPKQLSLGSAHTCVLFEDEGINCWGYNANAQLGNDAPGPQALDMETIVDIDLPGPASQVAAGVQSSCALLTDNSVHCWGQSLHGNLGLGVIDFNIIVPGRDESEVRVKEDDDNFDVIKIAASGENSYCVLSNDGNIRCWGYNENPQGHGILGYPFHDGHIGDTLDEMPPENLNLNSNALDMSVGGLVYCFLNDSQEVGCWGDNNFGVLGLGDALLSLMPPVPVDLSANVTKIASGALHTCALMDDGEVSCWGNNQWGQSGQALDNSGTKGNIGDDLVDLPIPTVPLEVAVSDLRIGRHSSCVLSPVGQNKQLHCWGKNGKGQLGQGHVEALGDDAHESYANLVPLGEDIRDAVMGGYHACAIMLDNSIRCWGRNDFFQLGYTHNENIADGQGDYPTIDSAEKIFFYEAD